MSFKYNKKNAEQITDHLLIIENLVKSTIDVLEEIFRIDEQIGNKTLSKEIGFEVFDQLTKHLSKIYDKVLKEKEIILKIEPTKKNQKFYDLSVRIVNKSIDFIKFSVGLLIEEVPANEENNKKLLEKLDDISNDSILAKMFIANNYLNKDSD